MEYNGRQVNLNTIEWRPVHRSEKMPEPATHGYKRIPPQRLQSQTALTITKTYTRGLADWQTPKPETQTCWVTFLVKSSKHRCPGQGVILVVSLPLSLRKVSQHVCVSGFGVGQSASPHICVVSVSVLEFFSFPCTGLPPFHLIFLVYHFTRQNNYHEMINPTAISPSSTW